MAYLPDYEFIITLLGRYQKCLKKKKSISNDAFKTHTILQVLISITTQIYLIFHR